MIPTGNTATLAEGIIVPWQAQSWPSLEMSDQCLSKLDAQ